MTFINSKPTKNILLTQQNKKSSVSNNLFYAGLSITILICTCATFEAIAPFLISCVSAASDTSFQSTSIPWLNNKSQCEETGRYWRDNQCWDQEHSPMF